MLKGEAGLTHLPRVLSENWIETALEFQRVRLIHDLLAAVWAVPCLEGGDLSYAQCRSS